MDALPLGYYSIAPSVFRCSNIVSKPSRQTSVTQYSFETEHGTVWSKLSVVSSGCLLQLFSNSVAFLRESLHVQSPHVSHHTNDRRIAKCNIHSEDFAYICRNQTPIPKSKSRFYLGKMPSPYPSACFLATRAHVSSFYSSALCFVTRLTGICIPGSFSSLLVSPHAHSLIVHL